MDNEIEVAGQFDQMNRVMEEVLKGNAVPAIAKSLSLTRVQVENNIQSWKELVQKDSRVRDRAKEALSAADEHYNLLIKEAWKVIGQADDAMELAVKNGAIKLIADIENKRIEMLNKAGVLESTGIGEQLLESERKQELLINILREVTSDCEKCKWQVASRLQEVTGHIESVQV